jgi:hypothetical protein
MVVSNATAAPAFTVYKKAINYSPLPWTVMTTTSFGVTQTGYQINRPRQLYLPSVLSFKSRNGELFVGQNGVWSIDGSNYFPPTSSTGTIVFNSMIGAHPIF